MSLTTYVSSRACERHFESVEICQVWLHLSVPRVGSTRKGERLLRERKLVLFSSSVGLTGKFGTFHFPSMKNMKSLLLIFESRKPIYLGFDSSEILFEVVWSFQSHRIRILRYKLPRITHRESSRIDKNDNMYLNMHARVNRKIQ